MSYQITIEPLGETITADDGQTILDACLRAGVWLPYACGHGICSTCKIKVLDGVVDHGDASSFALMDFERADNKCLACCARPESDLVIEADIDEEPDAENLPVADFIGTVTRITDLTPRIKGIFLHLNQPLVFQAGQYVNLYLPHLSQARAFSLANSPSLTQDIELNVSLIPDGKATTYLHQQLKVGDSLRLSAPYGRFFVRRSRAKPLLFIAGGSGLSSPKSMILSLLEQGETHPITLVQGARQVEELYYADLFRELASKYQNFTYIPTLSHANEDQTWTGLHGFAHEAAHAHFNGRFTGMTAYLCGPPAMIDACITTLMQGRLFEKDIFMERFFNYADTQQADKRSPLFKSI
ncbi:NADH:ubiquinone reductase (Na(+)-transporting) subunit F [Beggiatoa leptomitoformis]|uniref:2Fe-2S iron-sulfur cluster binding domain-containing protein n=1 Tax=Beggiatoa leptomitoformis TaxID=288004 RepID=A0A2N9YC88_9GAMM|nr:2Fe-2S iron-sulfur cluster binding domain-containing protein [Beggiatoa leptomitoformis]ALG66621.1 2Fe-2S iron-sulfur cluster binding domain-containing protein [Beggiatoa leptomitoformis]AUI68069.1 2Fe-2S iron-sulfur cluster binding domain-containing protein [Beggiatoa leptomitoformis]